MDGMKELYEKISKDAVLQEKFAAIMKDTEKAGVEATAAKLTAFAKEVGYDITVEEMQAFFKALMEQGDGELSDAELDQVAGGKTVEGVLISIATLGGLAVASALIPDNYDCLNI